MFKVIKTASYRIQQFSTSNIRSEALIISGNKLAAEVQDNLKISINKWNECGNKRPHLSAILVGNNPASKIYIEKKIKIASEIGIKGTTIYLNSTTTQDELLSRINQLNNDEDVDGIIVQLPLPSGIDEKLICDAVSPDKDVDGFHSTNIGKLSTDSDGFIPATALAVKELILKSGIKTLGQNALVIGRSKHVGLPIALLLHSNGKGHTKALDMTTTICHVHTPKEELIKYGKLADVVVSATGVPGLVTSDMIKPGACVIDVGITRVNMPNGKTKIVGDVDYEQVKNIAGFITPVPGGVGPMTVTMLMKNTFIATQKRHKQ